MTIKKECVQCDKDLLELRPYEKCMELGADYLTDAELLAVILRTGTRGVDSIALAKKVLGLNGDGGRLSGLTSITVSQLMKISGIGKVKAVQIKCICELARRIAKQNAYQRLDFSKPESIAGYYMQDMRNLDKEHLVVVMLDSKCSLIKDVLLSIGTVNCSMASPREIFIEALRYNAVNICLLHNHPSGDPTPSRADIDITRKVYDIGRMIGINLVDHIVIGDNVYISMKEKDFF